MNSNPSDPAMIEYYARRAEEYERIYQKPERQEDLQQLRALAAEFFHSTDVLEVACGTGYWTEVIARTASSVIATDINEEVLAIARSKPIDRTRVTFQVADAYGLAFPKKSFTAGLSAFWWSHVPKVKIRAFLENFHQTLSPGARLLFIDNNYVEGSSTLISRTDDAGNTYQLRRLDDGSVHEVLKNFPTESELCVAVNGLGRDIRVRHLRHYWALSYTIE